MIILITFRIITFGFLILLLWRYLEKGLHRIICCDFNVIKSANLNVEKDLLLDSVIKGVKVKILIEESLPLILHDRPLFQKMELEVVSGHRWLRAIFSRSAQFNIIYQLLSLFTSTIIAMAAVAIIYDISYGPESMSSGDCRSHRTEPSCVNDGGSISIKCEWVNPSAGNGGGTNGYCVSRCYACRVTDLLFAAILAAMISFPLLAISDLAMSKKKSNFAQRAVN